MAVEVRQTITVQVDFDADDVRDSLIYTWDLNTAHEIKDALIRSIGAQRPHPPVLVPRGTSLIEAHRNGNLASNGGCPSCADSCPPGKCLNRPA